MHCSLPIVALLLPLYVSLMGGCSWARTEPGVAPSTAPAVQPQLVVEVTEPAGVARTHWPITVGVPLPPGLLKDPSGLSVSEAEKLAALQTRVLSRWADGSVRWALLDWQVDLQPRQERRLRVAPGTSPGAASAVKVADKGDLIEVNTGPLQFSVAKNRFAPLTDVRLDGAPVVSGPVSAFFTIQDKRIEPRAPSTVTVTELGPLRARIELRGHYAAVFDYVVRIDAFANQPFVRVLHTFEQHSPEPYTSVRQLAITVPVSLEGKVSYTAGRETGAPFAGAVPMAGLTLVQEDNGTLIAGGERRAERAAGWVDLHDAKHGVAVAARFFWQQYPQSFEVRLSGVTYNLWAPQAPPAKVGIGAAKTHEMVVYFHGKTPPPPPLLAALGEPLLGTVDPQWIASTGALRNSVAPSPATNAFLREFGSGYRAYQRTALTERWDDSGEVRCPTAPATAQPTAGARPERPRSGFFGMFNWGDWNFPGYHDTTKGCDAWGNLEYDLAQVLALGYAATGDSSYYDGMVAAARHFMDVDRISFHNERPTWVGMNHPKNPLHFAFELGGVDLGHTWTEGLLSYYYLTGDERGLEAARGIADYLVRRSETTALRGNPRQWGWPQIALVAAYEATGNAAYKSAAHAYARKGMAAHPPDAVGDWKMGILADGLAHTHSVTQDSAIRDWLVRYAAAVTARGSEVDLRFLPAVAYVGRMSGDDRYLQTATKAVARLKFGNWGKPFTIAGRIGFRLLSLTAAKIRDRFD